MRRIAVIIVLPSRVADRHAWFDGCCACASAAVRRDDVMLAKKHLESRIDRLASVLRAESIWLGTQADVARVAGRRGAG